FTTGEDLNLAVRFENTGKVQAGPFGKVSVTKGDELVYDVDFNDKEQRDMVLPGSARRFTVPLEQIGGIGKYTVSATFTYGTQNKTIEVTESFWLIPRTAIIAGAVGLVLLI